MDSLLFASSLAQPVLNTVLPTQPETPRENLTPALESFLEADISAEHVKPVQEMGPSDEGDVAFPQPEEKPVEPFLPAFPQMDDNARLSALEFLLAHRQTNADSVDEIVSELEPDAFAAFRIPETPQFKVDIVIDAEIISEPVPEVVQAEYKQELSPAQSTSESAIVDTPATYVLFEELAREIANQQFDSPVQDTPLFQGRNGASLVPERNSSGEGEQTSEIYQPAIQAPRLIVTSPYTASSYEFLLISDETNIGRAGSSDLLLDQDNLTSRHHAQIKRLGDHILIFDKRSHNGVFINGQKIEAEHGYELADGDHIGIGNYELIFRYVPEIHTFQLI
jgi:hypothetical protein